MTKERPLHVQEGSASMIDVTEKPVTERTATASGTVFMKPETLSCIQTGHIGKGDVYAVAQVAGMMGAKRTADLIPMCHPISITNVDIRFETSIEEGAETAAVKIIATVKAFGPTGVEMEALTAVSITALTIYDMCKAIDKEIRVGRMGLVSKTGGKSGSYIRDTPL